MQQNQETSKNIHQSQTALLTREVTGDPVVFSLLLVHEQDHLMNAIISRSKKE